MKTFLQLLWAASLCGALFGGFLCLFAIFTGHQYTDNQMIFSALIAIALGILPHAAATAVTRLTELADKND